MQKFIITDPHYVIDPIVWKDLCEQVTFAVGQDEQLWQLYLNIAVTNSLQRITTTQAHACETGAGDWSNRLFGPNVLKDKFFSDSGMVCIFPLSDMLEEQLSSKNNLSGMAIFETSGDVSIDIDQSNPKWTIFRIQDNTTGDVWVTCSNSDEIRK